MGVPGFFAWLLKQYQINSKSHKDVIFKKLDKPVNALYFDANCLFHPKCFEIVKLCEDVTNIAKLESLMMERIIKYIDYVIDYVNPTDLVFIAVDGVAPMSKINQQRLRRFKSVKDTIIRNDIKHRNNIPVNTTWSNIVITPGTDFMIRLDKEIKEYINLKKSKIKQILYSSYEERGEGEHKIIQYIKTFNTPDLDSELKLNVIYGLDADLIFLSLSCDISNLYLLREQNHLDKIDKKELSLKDVTEPLVFVSIDSIKKFYNMFLLNKLGYDEVTEYNNKNYIKDFILLCFLLGNDFLPHLPSINIRTSGLDILIQTYLQMIETTDELLYDEKTDKINMNSFTMILMLLSQYEKSYFKEELQIYKSKMNRKQYNSRGSKNDRYDREIWELENLKFTNLEKLDKVKLGINSEEEWKFRYYQYYFHSITKQQRMIKTICNTYLETFLWVKEYYFNSHNTINNTNTNTNNNTNTNTNTINNDYFNYH